jgi:hypothetical protein
MMMTAEVAVGLERPTVRPLASFPAHNQPARQQTNKKNKKCTTQSPYIPSMRSVDAGSTGSWSRSQPSADILRRYCYFIIIMMVCRIRPPLEPSAETPQKWWPRWVVHRFKRSIDPTGKAAEHYCRSSIFGGRLAIPLLQRPILPMASSSLKDDIGSVATCGINHSRAVSFELPRRCYLCATSFFVGKPHTNLVIHSQKEIETTIACGLIAGNIFGRGGRRRKR